MTHFFLMKTNFSWRRSWLEITQSCSQETSILTTLPLSKWGLVMGLLMSPWHPPCSRHPLSTSWYKQMRRSLYKPPSFNPNLIHTAAACQYCMIIQSPGNGLTSRIAMLSACRPGKELGRKEVHLGRMEEDDLSFWWEILGGGKRNREGPPVSLSGQLQEWCLREFILSSVRSSSLSCVYLDSDMNN